jgi:hypothetical protein
MAKPMLVSKRRRSQETAIAQPVQQQPAKIRPAPPSAVPTIPVLSDGERYRQISLCAYFRAERRGFAPGHMWDDWLAAEQEVAARNARVVSKP